MLSLLDLVRVHRVSHSSQHSDLALALPYLEEADLPARLAR